jgi:hypothetical protein
LSFSIMAIVPGSRPERSRAMTSACMEAASCRPATVARSTGSSSAVPLTLPLRQSKSSATSREVRVVPSSNA